MISRASGGEGRQTKVVREVMETELQHPGERVFSELLCNANAHYKQPLSAAVSKSSSLPLMLQVANRHKPPCALRSRRPPSLFFNTLWTSPLML